MSVTISSVKNSAVSALETAFGNDPEQDFEALIDWLIYTGVPSSDDPAAVLTLAGMEPENGFSDPAASTIDAHNTMEAFVRGALLAKLYELQNP